MPSARHGSNEHVEKRLVAQLRLLRSQLQRRNQQLRAEIGFKIYVSPYEVSRIMKVVDEDFVGVISQLEPHEVHAGKGAEFVWVHSTTKEETSLRDSSIVCTQVPPPLPPPIAPPARALFLCSFI
jgi:hypothetical protein